MKKSIGDIALNVHGSQIAIVENQGGFDAVEESAVRIYNVGRKRNEDNAAVRNLDLFNADQLIYLLTRLRLPLVIPGG